MNRKFLLIGGVGVIALVLIFLALTRKGTGNIVQNLQNSVKKEISVGNDVCAEFPKEWVALATGKTIVKVTPSNTSGIATYACDYYINETNFVSIDVNDFSVEGQKKGQESFGRTLKTDPRIAMEHFIVLEKDGLIDSIYLVLTPNRFVTVDRFYGKVFDNEGVIAFAAKVAQRIQGSENQVAVPASNTATATPTPQAQVPLPQETDVVRSFFNLIAEHRVADAVSMLTPDQVSNDSQKQAWAVMFNGFESVSITKVEPSMPEDWTANAHTYRVTLDVKMKPESATATIPYFGYDNGVNTRFITLEKAGGLWKVMGIATGP